LDFGIPKEAENLFKAATECILDDSNNLRFWSDHWLGNFSIADIAPNLMRFVMSARKNDSVAFALENHAWTQAFSGEPSVLAIVEFMDLWGRLTGVTLTQGNRDSVKWRLTANNICSAKSAYNLFFLGRSEVPGIITPTAVSKMALWWPTLSEAVPAKFRKDLNSLVVLIARELWLERNTRIYDKFATMPGSLCRRIQGQFELWKSARISGGRIDRGVT
jgi:hypothetical protein